MDILKTIKRNPISTAFVVGIIGCFTLSSGNIQQPTDNVPQQLEQLYNSSSPAHEAEELSDLAQKILAFFDAAKNQSPKTLRDMKKAERLLGYTDTQLIIALTELVQAKKLIFDEKDS